MDHIPLWSSGVPQNQMAVCTIQLFGVRFAGQLNICFMFILGAPLEGYKVAVRDAKRHMWMEVGRVAADVQKLKVQELAVSLYISFG